MKSIVDLFKKILKVKIVRYLLTGGALFLIDYTIFYTLSERLGVDVRVSQFISRFTGAAIGFIAQKVFVFQNKDKRAFTLSVQGGLYIALTVVNIFLSGFLVAWLEKVLPMWENAAVPAFIVFLVRDWRIFVVKVINETIMVTETYIVLNLIFRKWKDVEEKTPSQTGNDDTGGSGKN